MNLIIKVGCDIVKISRFKLLIEKKIVLEKIFTNHELSKSNSLESLAGKFAGKEAVLKALELTPGNWNLIEIIKQENGKPVIKFTNNPNYKIISCDISISHDDEYAFASACFLIKN